MKTNIYTDEDSKNKDPDIGEQLEGLIEQVTSGLSGPALKFFNREFDFFNRVTNISGEIRYFELNWHNCVLWFRLKGSSQLQVFSSNYRPQNTCVKDLQWSPFFNSFIFITINPFALVNLKTYGKYLNHSDYLIHLVDV